MQPNKHRARFYSEQIGAIKSRQRWPVPSVISNLPLSDDIPDLFLDQLKEEKEPTRKFKSKTFAPNPNQVKKNLFLEMIEDNEESDDQLSVDSFELLIENKKKAENSQKNHQISILQNNPHNFSALDKQLINSEFENSSIKNHSTNNFAQFKNQQNEPRDEEPEKIEGQSLIAPKDAVAFDLSKGSQEADSRRRLKSVLSKQLKGPANHKTQPTDLPSGSKASVLLLNKRSQPESLENDGFPVSRNIFSVYQNGGEKKIPFQKRNQQNKNDFDNFRFNMKITRNSVFGNRPRFQSCCLSGQNTIFEFLQKK